MFAPVTLSGRVVPLTLAVLAAAVLPAAAQVPSISTTAPLAVKPGGSTNLVVKGGNLVGVSHLWTSFTAQTELAPGVKDNGKNAAECTWKVTLAADAAVGVYAIRVATPGGTTALKLIAVDDLPSVVQAGDNTSRAKAQALTLPAAVDGTIGALSKRLFKFSAAKDQTISFEVLARRLGSPLDPMLRLLAMNGRELAYSDDVPGLHGDSRLHYKFSVAGEYFVEVRDMTWQGGGGHFYRLRAGDFPCISVPYPLGVKRGTTATISFAGSSTEGISPVKLTVPADLPASWMTIGAKRAGGKSSGFVTLAVSDREEVVEVEPNDSRDKATRVPLGANLNGLFNKPADIDHFVFTAKKGQKFTLTGITRRQGAPTAIYARLLKADGGQVAEATDFGVADPVINYTFPADGDYTLVLQDRDRRGGGAFAYHINVAPTPTDFTLTASSDRVNIAAGGTAAITVTAGRRGYNGPITIAAIGLPKGITSTPTVIGAGRTNIQLTLTAADDAPVGKVFPVKVAGTAKVGDGNLKSAASISGALKAVFGGLPWPPETLSTAVAEEIGPKPQFSLRTETQQVVFGRDLSTSVKIIATRQKGFDEPITLAVTPAKNGLPGGISTGLKPIPKGKNEITITFAGNNKAPLGEFTVNINGSLKKGKATITHPVPAITLSLAAPLSLKATVAAPKLARGAQLKLKVTVERNPALKAPVVITLANLPKGVTAAAATIPADKTEVEIVLSAAQDALQGVVKNLTVKGEATVGKIKFAASAAPLGLTIE